MLSYAGGLPAAHSTLSFYSSQPALPNLCAQSTAQTADLAPLACARTLSVF